MASQKEERTWDKNELKRLPVDREKLLKGLASCAISGCKDCPYKPDCAQQGIDAIAYIGYLEHVLEEAGL